MIELETNGLPGATPAYRAVCQEGRCWRGDWHFVPAGPRRAEAAALRDGDDHLAEQHAETAAAL